MKTYIKEHLKLIVGIILIVLFLIFRVILVCVDGPHDLLTELISSLSFTVGLISGCLIVSPPNKSKVINEDISDLTTESRSLLELQNDEYNYGHNVSYTADDYME